VTNVALADGRNPTPGTKTSSLGAITATSLRPDMRASGVGDIVIGGASFYLHSNREFARELT